MGKILVRLDDDVEEWVRAEMVREYGSKKGNLNKFIHKVLRERMEVPRC